MFNIILRSLWQIMWPLGLLMWPLRFVICLCFCKTRQSLWWSCCHIYGGFKTYFSVQLIWRWTIIEFLKSDILSLYAISGRLLHCCKSEKILRHIQVHKHTISQLLRPQAFEPLIFWVKTCFLLCVNFTTTTKLNTPTSHNNNTP